MSHAANPDLLNRLLRANGNLAGIIKMDEDGDGLTITQQMQAVVVALEKTKTLIVTDQIERHLEELVAPLTKEVRDDLARLGELAKYLGDLASTATTQKSPFRTVAVLPTSGRLFI